MSIDDAIFVARDPLGRVIRLSKRCYQDHILVRHPDLHDVDEILRTVKAPEFIAEDIVDNMRSIYYRTYQRNPQQWMIKVVVEKEEVVTAYRVTRIKRGEVITWHR